MTAPEDAETRLKRLRIRSWRRGTREMDLILGDFFDAKGAALTPGDLDVYEALLDENDHDIYAWITGRADVPEAFAPLLDKVAEHRARA